MSCPNRMCPMWQRSTVILYPQSWDLSGSTCPTQRLLLVFSAVLPMQLHQAQLQQAMAAAPCQQGVPHNANVNHGIEANTLQAVHPMAGNHPAAGVSNQLDLPCGPAGQLPAQGLAIPGPQIQHHKQRASGGRGAKAGPATAPAAAAGLPPTGPAQLLSPVLLQQAAHAAGYAHAPVTPAAQSTGWLPPLFGPSQHNTAHAAGHLQHLISFPGQHAAAVAAPGHSHAQDSQQHLQLQQQQQLLLLQQQRQQEQGPQRLQHARGANQLHEGMHGSGSQTEGTVGCTEGMEESVGTGAGASASAGAARKPKRAGKSPAPKAAAGKSSKAAGRKRTAAAAGEGGTQAGGEAEDASEAPATKQGELMMLLSTKASRDRARRRVI